MVEAGPREGKIDSASRWEELPSSSKAGCTLGRAGPGWLPVLDRVEGQSPWLGVSGREWGVLSPPRTQPDQKQGVGGL